MAELTEDQIYSKCTDAGYTLGFKYGRGSDVDQVIRESKRMGSEFVDPNKAVCIDFNTFDSEKMMDLIKDTKKETVSLIGVNDDNRFQKEVDKKFRDPDCPVKDLTLSNGCLKMYGFSDKYPSVEKMTFSDMEFCGNLGNDLACKNLESLKIERCKAIYFDQQEKGVVVSALKIAEKHNLKKFTLREMSLKEGSKYFMNINIDWNKLPTTLEYLNLSKTDIMYGDFDGLMKVLPNLPNLKVVEMASCGLTAEHADKLAKALSESSVRHVNLSGNCFDDESKKKLRVDNKEVCLDGYFEWHGAEVAKMLNQTRPIEEAAQKASTKEEMVKTGVLRNAAKAGSFEDILKMLKQQNVYLTAEDYTTPGKDGRTIAEDLAKTNQVNSAFKPEYWVNPKDMQAAWNAVPDEGKEQLGPNGGKAAFQVRKNQVMMAAVRRNTLLAGKSR
ncbi:MAG: hypothetical protein MJ250_05260 [Alphaproteobacteria bacterium]|nr:hypothetical protein [Alphaproteobacteria bacterium]